MTVSSMVVRPCESLKFDSIYFSFIRIKLFVYVSESKIIPYLQRIWNVNRPSKSLQHHSNTEQDIKLTCSDKEYFLREMFKLIWPL